MTLSVQNHVRIIRKNNVKLKIKLTTDDAPISNLGTALSARFVAVSTQGDLVIDKDLSNGITLDDPEVGTVTIVLDSSDTDIEYGEYDIAFQAVWGPVDMLEWNMPAPLRIEEELIP